MFALLDHALVAGAVLWALHTCVVRLRPRAGASCAACPKQQRTKSASQLVQLRRRGSA